MHIDTSSPLNTLVHILKIAAGALFLGGLISLANVAFGLDYVLGVGGFYFELPNTYLKGGLILGGGVILYAVDKFVIEKKLAKKD